MQLSTFTKVPTKRTNRVFQLGTFIAIGVLTAIGGQAFAQNGFDFSLKGMAQASSLINSKDQSAGPEVDYKFGVHGAFGASVGYTFSEHMGAELGVLYSKQGQGYTGSCADVTHNTADLVYMSQEFESLAIKNGITFTGTYTANVSMTEIKVPILFRFTGDNTRKSYFTGFLGPQINLIEDVKATINGKDAPYKSIGVKAEDIYRKTNVAAVLGLGVCFKLTDNLLLSGHIRFDGGLMDAENKDAKYGTIKFYDKTRGKNWDVTGGAMISVSYKLVKKAKKDDKATTTKSVEKTKKK